MGFEIGCLDCFADGILNDELKEIGKEVWGREARTVPCNVQSDVKVMRTILRIELAMLSPREECLRVECYGRRRELQILFDVR